MQFKNKLAQGRNLQKQVLTFDRLMVITSEL